MTLPTNQASWPTSCWQLPVRLARESGPQPVPAHDVCNGFADLHLPA
jgi:hypothetical protein